jgi:DNA-binding CsgD family transcriptional regulator
VAAFGKATPEAPLVGREAELALVAARVRSGARAVVVTGNAGVGKTRLLHEVAARARADGHVVEQMLATAAARELPFAACATLPVAGAAPTSVVEFTAVLRERLVGPAVLIVDDAQHLDPGSVQVVVAATHLDGVTCVIAARRGEPVNETLLRLATDPGGTRLELQELSEAETAELAGGLLGGIVERRTARRLFNACRGNALYLHELVAALQGNGNLTTTDGVVRWPDTNDDRPVISARLEEIVGARLEALTIGERDALELVALGEPLELRVLAALGIADDVSRLERAGFVRTSIDGARAAVVVAHPLYGELALHRAGEIARRSARARLSRVLRREPLARAGDRLRLAALEMYADTVSDPALLLDAAHDARARGDLLLAQRLAECAARFGAGDDATLVALLAQRDRGDDVGAVARFEDFLDQDLSDEARVRAVEALVASYAKLTRPDDARRVLAENRLRIADPDVAALLAAIGAVNFPSGSLADSPRPELWPARDATDDVTQRSAEILQWLGTAHADLQRGRYLDLLKQSPTVLANALQLAAARPEAAMWVSILRGYALGSVARFDDVEALGHVVLDAVRDQPTGIARAWFLDLLAAYDLEQGNVVRARTRAAESAALRRSDDPALLASPLVTLTIAHAQLGDIDAAQRTLDECLGCTVTSLFGATIERPRAEAAVLAARGRVGAARDVVDDAARAAEARDAGFFSVWAWRDVARYGGDADAAAALRALAPVVEGPLPTVFAAAATARAAGDVDAMLASSEPLLAHGLRLDAAETLAAARLAAPRALEIDRRLTALRRELPGVVTPLLSVHDAPAKHGLTAREREVAALAVAGRRDAEIAAELFVSVRTVNSHLRSIYTKLGVTGRAELSAALQER